MKTVKKCKHYHIHKWGEPPLEPNENGTLHTENQCKIKKGNPEVFCNGDLSFCEVLINRKEIISLIDEMIEDRQGAKLINESDYELKELMDEGIEALTELKNRIGEIK